MRYWMTTGVRLIKVNAEYAREPRFRIDGEIVEDFYSGYQGITLEPREFYLPVEEFAEATGPNVPYTREEFRALCDNAGSREAIVQAVQRGRYSRAWLALPWVAGGVLGLLVAIVVGRVVWKRLRPAT